MIRLMKMTRDTVTVPGAVRVSSVGSTTGRTLSGHGSNGAYPSLVALPSPSSGGTLRPLTNGSLGLCLCLVSGS